ncbi:LytR/AlgR family response regulator transcription factor [Taibaiella helva]|uniref:LytR/AlgR family response regulator transcription factor n=1 Tax=Taibaiella helva TaxID=2301235 RepID=UPI000E57DF87|nr:LytTR family DNA-binding domain-containing protein [Taibaiella helva]
MARILIIDDDPAICRHLEALIAAGSNHIIAGSTGRISEAGVLLATTRPDIVLLDIELKDGNAFDLLQALPQGHSFQVIFITAYNEYAIRAIKFGALDYLLKPVDTGELYGALNKAARAKEPGPERLAITIDHLSSRDHAADGRIALRSQQYLTVAYFSEIVYCEGNAGYTTFYFADNRKELVTRSIKEYETLLPASWFTRTHQSYLVNHRMVRKYHKDGYLIMQNGAEIPVAVRKRDAVIKAISE